MLVFTSCSSTKKILAPASLRASGVRARTLGGFARDWAARVEAAPVRHAASEIYAGNAVVAAQAAADRLSAPLHFVSAGMSVVGPRARIPSYDLTVASGGDAPYPIATGAARPREWWAALNSALGRRTPLANVVRQHDSLVLVALPDSYLQMVQDELLTLSAKQLAKLRLIATSNARIAPELQGQTIRFDQRFQTAAGAPRGAQASFVQRALLHLAGLLLDNPTKRTVGAQRALVDQSLQASTLARRRNGVRLSDSEVLRWLGEQDPRSSQSRTALLKAFRGQGLACEQKKFFALIDSTRI